MGYSKYTEEQITEFINQANEMGISPAMRHLGYPASYHTAKTFYEKRGVEMPTINTLAQMARNIGVFCFRTLAVFRGAETFNLVLFPSWHILL